MPPKMDENQLAERHAAWLALYQESRFQPTIREIGDAWGVASTSYVRFVIGKMLERGLADFDRRGSYRRYYPLPIVAEKEEQS